MNNRREQGRTLIETLAVLGVMGILTVGSIGIYTNARNKLLRMQSVDEISELADDIRTLFAGKGSYEGLTIGYLRRMGALEKMTNPFGEEIVVRSANRNEEFGITYSRLSQANCIYFGAIEWEDAERVFVNGSEINTNPRQSERDTLKIKCQKGQINNVTIYYK